MAQFTGWTIIMVWGIVYIPFRRTTAVAQAWLLLFLFLPWIAILLYAVFGRTGHPAWRRERFARVPSIVERTIEDAALLDRDLPPGAGANVRRTAGLVERIGGLPCIGGNAIDLDAEYERVIRRIVEDIDGARDHVHVLFYILHADEAGNQLLGALERATLRGVTCRLLIDAVGSSRHRRRIAERLEGTGIELALILPLRLWTHATRFDLRNHRKIVVVDGSIGWVGSQNMHRREYEPATFYRDVMARIAGPAVSQLQAVFLGDWFLETDREVVLPGSQPKRTSDTRPGTLLQVMPTGPDYPDARVDILFTSLIHKATDRVVLATPYFIPNEPLLQAFATAVANGVDVVLFVTGSTGSLFIDLAQESYYEDLLAAGVTVHRYRDGFLHSKHLSVDGEIAIVGSSNMDQRSFELNAEVTLIAYDQSAVAALAAIEADYLTKSQALRSADWRRRPFLRKVAENVMRLVSPLL